MNDESVERRDQRRRAEDAMAFQLMQETRQMVKEIEEAMDAKFDSLTSELHTHRIQSEQRHGEIAHRIDQISQSTIAAITEHGRLIKELNASLRDAFPGGDPEQHRIAHESWIKKSEKEEEFWLDVKKKAVGSIVTGLIVWVGFALWTAFLQGPK